jgi:hypothetical protein
MYAYIYWAPEWMHSGSQWMNKAASGYRGDAVHRKANEALR